MTIKKIYLDMDGVLAQFIEAICDLHQKPNPYLNRADAAGVWEVEELLGMTTDDFWKPTSTEFWNGIQKYPTANLLVYACADMVGVDNLHILTSPVRKDRGQQMQDACLKGKTQWIVRHFPLLQSRIHFARTKSKYAEEGVLLIDDKDQNVERFREAGGLAILVPRMWNSDHRFSLCSHATVLERLSNLQA